MGDNGLKLFVDDWREAPPGWHLCKTITEAVRLLSQVPVTQVTLDLDPGYSRQEGDKHTPIDSEDFSAVAWFIRQMPADQRPEVFVHSANPDAVDIIQSILPEAQRLLPEHLE
jgi:hypothetical protein